MLETSFFLSLIWIYPIRPFFTVDAITFGLLLCNKRVPLSSGKGQRNNSNKTLTSCIVVRHSHVMTWWWGCFAARYSREISSLDKNPSQISNWKPTGFDLKFDQCFWTVFIFTLLLLFLSLLLLLVLFITFLMISFLSFFYLYLNDCDGIISSESDIKIQVVKWKNSMRPFFFMISQLKRSVNFCTVATLDRCHRFGQFRFLLSLYFSFSYAQYQKIYLKGQMADITTPHHHCCHKSNWKNEPNCLRFNCVGPIIYVFI